MQSFDFERRNPTFKREKGGKTIERYDEWFMPIRKELRKKRGSRGED